MLLVLFFVVLFILTFFTLFADITSKTVTQNDYTVLTDVTGYLRDLEAGLRNLVEGEGREGLEKDLDEECLAQTGQHVYEFVYSLPDFGFDDITLMAYLSARFFEFSLEAVQAELVRNPEDCIQIHTHAVRSARDIRADVPDQYTV